MNFTSFFQQITDRICVRFQDKVICKKESKKYQKLYSI